MDFRGRCVRLFKIWIYKFISSNWDEVRINDDDNDNDVDDDDTKITIINGVNREGILNEWGVS
jgi:hypothetical protein